MFKAVFVAIAAVMLVWSAPVAAQQKRVAVGPVVTAFLTGLDEDLTELEFQIRHNEISRKDYERTKQRLIVLKRFVERSSALNPEDRVPELQVLADDELIALNPGAELNLNDLKIGAQASARWKLVGIERVRERYFPTQWAVMGDICVTPTLPAPFVPNPPPGPPLAPPPDEPPTSPAE